MKADDVLFEIAAREVSSHQVVKGLMARAFSEALGDKDKTVALYIKYRVENLKEEHDVRARQTAESEQKKQKQIQKEVRKERVEMATLLITVCKKCGFAGQMNAASMLPGSFNIFAKACKCPKCSNHFNWYYVSSEVIKQRIQSQG